jgi:hypothetical protein
MTADEALTFVREQGVVLVSGKGPVPRLVEAIAGEPVRGGWWAHAKSHQIFAILQAVVAAPDVLVCRLVDGKLTLVHRRLWPALVRCARRFAPQRIAQVREEHTASGRHVTSEIAFPKWVPREIKERAKSIAEEEALQALGAWASAAEPFPKRARRRRQA